MALSLLGPTNELFDLVKTLNKRLRGQKATGHIDRYRLMTMTYGLITYSSFFEVMSESLPDVRRSLALKDQLTIDTGELVATDLSDDVGLNTNPILMPHPVSGFAAQAEQVDRLYHQMKTGYVALLQGLPEWTSAAEESRQEVLRRTAVLPRLAHERFEAQYVDLATRFEEFFVWSSLHEHAAGQARVKELSTAVQALIELGRDNRDEMDGGFQKLHEAIQDIFQLHDQTEANEVLASLARWYDESIDSPIVGKRTDSDAWRDEPVLRYPTKQQVFIPQEFRVTRFDSTSQLADEDTWEHLPVQDNLGPFLLSLLSSPYSLETPILILGQPGSGKSLLTEILAARLAWKSHTPLRVQLRDVRADLDVQQQVEEQLRKITRMPINWVSLTSTFGDRPALLILDGYDELLQASGRVMSSYLGQVKALQEAENRDGRPLRVIVTSRMALIDKAAVPDGCTVIRLEDFDDFRRSKWISIWNAVNQRYFATSGVAPFELPPEDDQLQLLAAQPLLLLMLALYDSNGNALRGSRDLDRSRLYNDLLVRFIEREWIRRDESAWIAQSGRERQQIVDRDIERLGVAAIAMFNRWSTHIRVEDLEDDLRFFCGGTGAAEEGPGYRLNRAEMVLGGFFFVHEWHARYEADDRRTAFEFLHATFGEFLAADYILRQVLSLTMTIGELSASEHLKEKIPTVVSDPGRTWFGCLACRPLFTRPTVAWMLREWAERRLDTEGLSRSEFLKCLDEVVSRHLRQVLGSTRLPAGLSDERSTAPMPPLLGRIATYSANLVILRTILSDGVFRFQEGPAAEDGSAVRPWDQLTHLWRAWFSADDLNGLAALLEAERGPEAVSLRAKQDFRVPPSCDQLERLVNRSLSLADDVTLGLALVASHDRLALTPVSLDDVGPRLQREGVDLRLRILLVQLRELARSRSREVLEAGRPEALREAVGLVFEQFERYPSTALEVLRLVVRADTRSAVADGLLLAAVQRALRMFLASPVLDSRPELAVEMLKTIVRDPRSFPPGAIEEILYSVDPRALGTRRPAVLLDMFPVALQCGDDRVVAYTSALKAADIREALREEPARAVAALVALRSRSDAEVFRSVDRRLLAAVDGTDLWFSDPESAARLICLLRANDADALTQEPGLHVSKFQDPGPFVRLMGRRPDLAAGFVRFLYESDDLKTCEARALSLISWIRRHVNSPYVCESIADLVELARGMAPETGMLDDLATELHLLLTPLGAPSTTSVAQRLPLRLLGGLRWLAQKEGDAELAEAVDALAGVRS